MLNALLHNTDVLYLIAPTFSSMLTLNESGQNVKMAAWLFPLSTMGYEPVYIGLKWIEMVEILVGEVDRRSPKDGSRAQLIQVNRDKVCHEAFDLEAS